MAPGLQNQLAARGDPLPQHSILPFFGGLLDERSLQALLLLNSVPVETSGLIKPVSPNMANLDPKRWFAELDLTNADINEAFVFALITEQLKRVDALLKGSVAMAEIIASKANPSGEVTWPTEFYSDLTETQRLEALKKLPALTWSHPISLASLNELDRVLTHLSALRSGHDAMVQRARSGLLDLLRNSLSEIWLGRDAGASQVRRSIFNAMLSALNRMAATDPTDRALTFSLLLTSVQRMWSVRWALGQRVMINVVRSRIESSAVVAKDRVAKRGASISLTNFRI